MDCSGRELRLLGSVEFGNDGTTQPLLLGPKSLALLALLAAQTQPLRRRHLLDMLFADEDTRDPAGNLRWHLSQIRNALGKDVLIAKDASVVFYHKHCRVDAVDFAATIVANLASLSEADLIRVANLYRGPFLDELRYDGGPAFAGWQLSLRAELDAHYLNLLRHLVERTTAAGNLREAVLWARRFVDADHLSEEAHTTLVRLYLATGQAYAARRQLELCRQVLLKELDLELGPELIALAAALPQSSVVEVTHGAAGERRGGAASGNFVGREDELDALQELWDALGGQSGAMALVEGEAGSGKSSLIRTFAATLPPGRALIGVCYESTQILPFRPWITVLERCLSANPALTLSTLPPIWLDLLARLAPSLGERFQRPAVSGVNHTPEEIDQTFRAVTAVLARAATESPLVVTIDNLHWADELSLRLFQHLASYLADATAVPPPLLLIGCFRSEEPAQAMHQIIMGEVKNLASRLLSLFPLDGPAVVELLGRQFPGLPLAERTARSYKLLRATGGNPLLVRELLREDPSGTSELRPAAVPVMVHDLVRRRLGAMSTEVRQTIEAMAVLSIPVTLQEAGQLLIRDEAAVAEAIDLGTQLRLLREDSAQLPTRYDLAHDLLRTAVVSQVSPARRSLLHRQLGTALGHYAEELAPGRGGELAALIVQHALKGEAFALALSWVAAATAHARNLGAFTDALTIAERVLSTVEHASWRPSGPGDTALLAIELERADLLYMLGRRIEGEQILAGLEAARVRAAPLLNIRLHLLRSQYLGAAFNFTVAFEASEQALDLAAQLDDNGQMALARFIAGKIKMHQGDNVAGRRLHEEALELFRRAGDLGNEVLCRSSLGWCVVRLGDVPSALGHLEQALKITHKRGDIYGQAFTCTVLAGVWNYYYHHSLVRAYAETALRLCRENAIASLTGVSLLYIAVLAWYEGRLAEAETLCGEALVAARVAADGWAEGWATQTLGRIALDRGNLAGAARLLDEARHLRAARSDPHGELNDLAWLGRVHLAAGRPEAALAYTGEATARVEQLVGQLYIWEVHDVWLSHGEVLATLGRSLESYLAVQRAYTELRTFAEGIADPAMQASFLGHPTSVRVIAAWTVKEAQATERYIS